LAGIGLLAAGVVVAHASAGMAAELSSVPPDRQDTYPTPGRPARRLLRYTRYPI